MTTSTYDDIAEWYDNLVGTHFAHEDPFFPAVEALIDEVADLRICDLACGQGKVARHLAHLGARVVGIDTSAHKLNIARHHEEVEPHGIAYLQADVYNLNYDTLGLFDGAVCWMALMNMPDLTQTLRNIARLLRPSGWFVFSILHPCFHTSQSGTLETPEGTVRTISQYFREAHEPTDQTSNVGAYHRTLSTYVNTLTATGFIQEHVSEPRLADDLPSVWAEIPAVLIVQCKKNYLPSWL